MSVVLRRKMEQIRKQKNEVGMFSRRSPPKKILSDRIIPKKLLMDSGINASMRFEMYSMKHLMFSRRIM